MKIKRMKDLHTGEVFLDSLGCELRVVAVIAVPWSGIPRTSPRVKVTLQTKSGREMFQHFNADREVFVL